MDKLSNNDHVLIFKIGVEERTEQNSTINKYIFIIKKIPKEQVCCTNCNINQ